MTDRELRKLSRKDLLEILIKQSKEIDNIQKRLDEVEEKLKDKRIKLEEAGSIAEAALKLNGIFEAAERAANQYLENVFEMGQEKKTKAEGEG